jgi:hypothetical protein
MRVASFPPLPGLAGAGKEGQDLAGGGFLAGGWCAWIW